MITPIMAKRRTPPKRPDPIISERFGGIDKSTNATEIDITRSPGMSNMLYDHQGILNKRMGYKRIYATTLGTGSINGLFYFSGKFIIAHGTKLYTQTGTSQPVELYSGISGKVRAFEMGGYLYIKDKDHYLRYDGTTVVDVSTVATIPTLTMGRGTDGGGTPLDQYNLLTPYFYDSFSPDGAALTYPMSLDGLDIDIPIIASIDSGLTFDKAETTDFTVDRDTGIVTWLAAPLEGVDTVKVRAAKTVGTFEVVTVKITHAAEADGDITLNLNGVAETVTVANGDSINDVAGKIRAATITNWTITGATDTAILTCKTAGVKATSTFAGGTTAVTATVTIVKGTNSKADLIKKCTIFGKFGGANDTHMFFTGNSTVNNLDYRSEVSDPTMFPENGWTVIGDDAESITGYTVQYDLQIIQRTASKWSRQYVLSGGVASYPLKPVSAERGCTAPDSLQLIDNNPMCLDALGINTIESGQVRDERYTKHKSTAIDPDLSLETTSPVSANYNNKYWLAFGDNVYVADYRHKYTDEYGEIQYEWFELFDLPITCFCEQGGYLYFGGQGLIYRFLLYTEENTFYDDGEAISCEFPFKIVNFGTDDLFKKVNYLVFTLKPDIHSSADVYYVTDEIPETFIETIRMDSLDFGDVDFEHFSFDTSVFPMPATIEVNESKLSHFQYILKNSVAGESMGVLRSEIHFVYQGRRR
jgi:hypothetical protein